MVRWESQKEAALWAALRIYFACAIKHHLIFDSYNMFYCFSIKRSYSMQLPEKWQGLHMQSPKPACYPYAANRNEIYCEAASNV